ncbi:hypothetical protein ES703_25832 [subsurface metagenome]
MPLAPEVLAEMKEKIDRAKERIADLSDIIADMRKSNLETETKEADIKALKAQLRRWESFYDLQSRRQPTE